eukprot:686632-Hanusia_phi.AAC.2
MGAKPGKYQGELKNGKRHGWGLCAFSDRSYYEGEWANDKIDGEGRYVRPDGSTYEGFWENNLQNGFGRLILANGDVYEGHFRDGRIDGYGTYFYKNGSIYDGEFMEDEAHGVGTFKGVNGEFYQGEWQVDKMHGVGVYKFVGGAKYRGEFKFGKMDGYGVYEIMERGGFVGKYEGQFLGGRMDGLGLYFWPEGDIFMGEYAQDKRFGYGVYTSSKGAVFKGEYRAGERHGWGEFVTSNGDIYEGQWKHDQRHGKGVVTLAEADPELLKNAQREADQRKWAQVWFKDSPAVPVDSAGRELEIDPTRTFTGYWSEGKVKAKRPYRYDDWAEIQANSSLAAEHAGRAVEEAQKAVALARKACEFAEDAAKRTVKKMEVEMEPRRAYFLRFQPGASRRDFEDKHLVRLGPEITRNTFLVMLGASQAAQVEAMATEVSWIAAIARQGDEQDEAVRGLMSVSVFSWIARASRKERKEGPWHVKKPHIGGTRGLDPLRQGGASSEEPGGGGGMERRELKLDEDIVVANLSDGKVREVMKRFQEEGDPAKQRQHQHHASSLARPPRPRGQPAAFNSVRVHAAGKEGNSFEEVIAGHIESIAPVAPAPPPHKKQHAPADPRSASRHSRLSAPRWAGGAPMPPSSEMMAKMRKNV